MNSGINIQYGKVSPYKSFKVFGDGGEDMAVLATRDDGKQEAFIAHHPWLEEINVTPITQKVNQGWLVISEYVIDTIICFNFRARKFTMQIGEDLEKDLDPVLKKTIRQLLAVVNKKFDGRKI